MGPVNEQTEYLNTGVTHGILEAANKYSIDKFKGEENNNKLDCSLKWKH